MKIAQVKISSELIATKRMGIIEGQEFIDIQNVMINQFKIENKYHNYQLAQHFFPSNTSNFVELYQGDTVKKLEDILGVYQHLKKMGLETSSPLSYKLDHSSLKLSKPLSHINCYRDFYIHEKHVVKGFQKRNEPVPKAWYEMPVYYKGPTSGFIGHQDTIPWPSYTQKLDYELELGCVLMKDGKNISEKNASEHILGFTIFNDISARDIQKKEMSVRLGPSKGKDFCSVVGPVIVTKDEVSAEPDLLMQAFINDKLWSEGRSSEGKYSWAEMISFASKEEWLLATDFLGSGTVGTGCGLELDKWVKKGDEIKFKVESIGELVNKIQS